MTKIVLASTNPGKLKELNDLLKPLDIDVVSVAEFNIPDIEETEDTFEGNALLKAKETARLTGLPALADDSGLCVHCLNGRPGVYTARSYDSKTKGFPHAFKMMNEEMGKNPDRSAHFECCIALALPGGGTVAVTGETSGVIVYPARGEDGFAYDPIFMPDGYGKTYAELGKETKNKISHRAKAVSKMIEIMKEMKAEGKL